jgi:AcrR family transcriptional regulator
VTRTQRERSKSTIASLLSAARELFVRNGYAATSLADVAAAAGVTKGALYHHFTGKSALFCAVYEREQHAMMGGIVFAYHREPDAWSAFRAGVQASLTISCRPDVQRITLVDAPSAIGWGTMREIGDRYTMRILERGLRRVIDEGWLEPRPVTPLASFLFGGISEIAMAIAHSKQPHEDKATAAAEVDRIIDALARPARSSRIIS